MSTERQSSNAPMAVGCPVIVFKRGAVPEIVTYRRSGFLVQSVNEMVQGDQYVEALLRGQGCQAVEGGVLHHWLA
jgi:glycosyltransferase involved in cell wall biosynthesis